MNILILGGGFGGAAHTLRNTLGSEHEVTLMNQSNYFYLRAAFPSGEVRFLCQKPYFPTRMESGE